jgi:hypothetical protein
MVRSKSGCFTCYKCPSFSHAKTAKDAERFGLVEECLLSDERFLTRLFYSAILSEESFMKMIRTLVLPLVEIKCPLFQLLKSVMQNLIMALSGYTVDAAVFDYFIVNRIVEHDFPSDGAIVQIFDDVVERYDSCSPNTEFFAYLGERAKR